jgi:hypothetical protein
VGAPPNRRAVHAKKDMGLFGKNFLGSFIPSDLPSGKVIKNAPLVLIFHREDMWENPEF